jgi:putative inorganic carbon (hco3(-)) transporter
MAVRLQRQSPLLAFVAVVLIGGVGGVLASHRVSGLDPFVGASIGMAAGAAAVTCLVVLEPALILTAAMVLSVFSGNWSNMGIPIPLDRIAVACGIATALIRSIRDREVPRIRAIHWLMLLLVLYAVTSAAWSNTLTQHQPEFALVDRLGIVPFLLFLVAPVAFKTPEQRRILAIGLVILGGYLGLMALFERLHANGLVWPSYITDQSIGITFGRSRGPFLEAGADGLAMFDCMCAAAITLPYWEGRPKLRAAVIGVMILCLAGLVFTLTRQVWAGAAVGAAVAMLSNRRLRRLLPATAVVSVVAVVAALAFVPGLQQSINSRTNDQSSVWDRLNSDAAALRMVETRPALGFGWGQFGSDSAPYYRLAATYPLSTVNTVHNMPLSNAAELGLVGAGLWLVILLMGIVAPTLGRAPPAVEPWRLALIAMAIAWFVQANLSPLDYAFDNYVIWLWAGIVAGGRERRESVHEPAVATRVPSLSAA